MRTLQNSWHKLYPVTVWYKDAGENFVGFNLNEAKAKVADLLRYARRIHINVGTDLDEDDIVTWLNCDNDAPVV